MRCIYIYVVDIVISNKILHKALCSRILFLFYGYFVYATLPILDLMKLKINFQAVSNHMELRCKCHGMSGSCQLKTCWKSAPNFHIVGKLLKHQFRRAILVDQSNLGNGEPIIVLKRSRTKKQNSAIKLEQVGDRERNDRPVRKIKIEKNEKRLASSLLTSLFYYQRSPNFCERDLNADIQGKLLLVYLIILSRYVTQSIQVLFT